MPQNYDSFAKITGVYGGYSSRFRESGIATNFLTTLSFI